MNQDSKPSTQIKLAGAVIALVTAFALTGCVPDQAPTTGSSSGGGDSVSPVGSDPNATDSNNTDSDSENPSADDASTALSGKACLYGNWYLDNESFHTILEKAGGTVREVTGWVVFTFHEDGTTSSLYDEWTTVVESDGSTATMVRNGQDFGTFSADDDGTLTMISTESNSAVVMTMNMPGAPPITTRAETDNTPLTNGSFTCEGDQLSVFAEGTTSVFFREH